MNVPRSILLYDIPWIMVCIRIMPVMYLLLCEQEHYERRHVAIFLRLIAINNYNEYIHSYSSIIILKEAM